MQNNTIYTLENMKKLLDFCIYQLYEKKNQDFDWEFYLEFISDRLEKIIDNQK